MNVSELRKRLEDAKAFIKDTQEMPIADNERQRLIDRALNLTGEDIENAELSYIDHGDEILNNLMKMCMVAKDKVKARKLFIAVAKQVFYLFRNNDILRTPFKPGLTMKKWLDKTMETYDQNCARFNALAEAAKSQDGKNERFVQKLKNLTKSKSSIIKMEVN